MGRRSQWVDKATYRDALDKLTHAREEVAQLSSELDVERRRYAALVGSLQGKRSGKAATTLDLACHMLNEVGLELPKLDANASTHGIARRLRSILGIYARPDDGDKPSEST